MFKNNLRTIEAQIVQILKNNEAQPKFTGSYKKKMRVMNKRLSQATSQQLVLDVCMVSSLKCNCLNISLSCL